MTPITAESYGISDAVAIRQDLFNETQPPCWVVYDVNSSGAVSVADPVYLRTFLFRGGPPPGSPHPQCASLEGANDAGCRVSCP